MRGTAALKEWEQRLLDERESVHVTARCAWCPWQLDGTVLKTREAFAAHRATEHPEVNPRPRRKRHRPFGALQSSKGLDENIAEARKTGAAGWAGPE